MKDFFKKINKEKLKEISLVIFAFCLVGIGYVNFANNDTEVLETYAKSSNSLGDVELVSGNVVQEATLVENNSQENEIAESTIVSKNEVQESSNVKTEVANIVSNDTETNTQNNVSVSTSSNDKNNYFSEVKLNRDVMYDEILETYQKMIDSSSISSEQKSIAVQEIEKITKLKSSISVAEELIKLKGFENVVILVNDENVNVVVRIAVLSKEQVVQIQNIVTKELGVEVQNVSISTK